jgi:hypothetical protein
MQVLNRLPWLRNSLEITVFSEVAAEDKNTIFILQTGCGT